MRDSAAPMARSGTLPMQPGTLAMPAPERTKIESMGYVVYPEDSSVDS